MRNFNSLKDLWKRQSGHDKLPDVSEMMSMIEKNHRDTIRQHTLNILSLAVTMCLIIIIGIFFTGNLHFKTTYIGIILIILAIIFGIIIRMRLLSVLLKGINLSLECKLYLDQMKKYLHVFQFFYIRSMKIYIILLSIAFIFYLWEFVYRFFIIGIIAYVLTFGCLAFGYFFISKRDEIKKLKKLKDQIERIEILIANMEK